MSGELAADALRIAMAAAEGMQLGELPGGQVVFLNADRRVAPHTSTVMLPTGGSMLVVQQDAKSFWQRILQAVQADVVQQPGICHGAIAPQAR